MGKLDLDITWLIQIFIILFVCLNITLTSDCLFDEIEPGNILYKKVDYEKTLPQRGRRNTNLTFERSFQAIRISPQYHFGIELTEKEKIALKKIIARAVKKISKLFSVIPVQGPLVLKRSACHSQWSSGINKGKCSRIKKGYRGEYCLDNFKLPDAHLEGQLLYDKYNPKPTKYAIIDGEGISDADFILYVTSQTTHNCLEGKTSVIAYASYCQLDQMDRPIAGRVNFCPLLLKSKYFHREKSYIAALHEMFHALGFSKRLFSKYKACSETGTMCTKHPQPLREVDEVLRLATPAVVEKTQDHFGCFSDDGYGGPIDTSEAPVSSHWDSKFMQGSLMTTKNDLPHLTFIDPITLAVFEDTGWYKVNYSQADNYLWGKDAGCLFGLTEFCMIQTNFFCSGSSSGCHYLHLDRGVCSTDSNLSPCKVVMANEGDQCFTSGKTRAGNTSAEVLSPHSRCFLSNLTSHSSGEMDISGRCYEHRCLNGTELQIRINNSTWLNCTAGSYLQFPSHRGGIFCPENPEIICSDLNSFSSKDNLDILGDVSFSRQLEAHVTMTTYTSTIKYDSSNITIEMTFKSDDEHLSWGTSVKSKFEKAVVGLVVTLSDVSAVRIHNIDSYFNEGHAFVTFLIAGAGAIRNESSAEKASHLLEDALTSENKPLVISVSGHSKAFHLQGVSIKYSTWFSDIVSEKSNPSPEIKPEVIVGILLAVVAVVVLITIIAMIVRRKKSLTAPSGGDEPRDSEQPLVGSSPGPRAEASTSGLTERLAQIPENDIVLSVEPDQSNVIEESTSQV